MSTIVFFDGVSGVGKTRFLNYCRRNYGVSVFSIKQNMTFHDHEIAREFLSVKNGLKSYKAKLFYFSLWLKLCNDILDSKDKLIFIDRSPASSILYNGDSNRMIENTLKEILGERKIRTILCDGRTNFVRHNKGLKRNDKLLDHNGVECSYMLKVWREFKPFGKDWDYIAHMAGYKDSPKRLAEFVFKAIR